MTYRRRASPLHAARAAAGGAWCLAVGAAALAAQHPVLLGGLLLVVLGAARAAGVLRAVLGTLRWTLPFALVIMVVNAVTARQGLTVLARLGELPPFGQVDVTLEAVVYGALFGLRVAVVLAASALFTAAVDPDEVLRLFRRLSLRSALAASLAIRLMPVLAADARRIDDARRCRPDGGGDGLRGRVAVLRAVTAGALDRALDVAATLEVRGYGTARRPRGSGRPWSRHDLAFTAAALLVAAVTVLLRAGHVAAFEAYPQLDGDPALEALAVACAVALLALWPFAQRRGIEP